MQPRRTYQPLTLTQKPIKQSPQLEDFFARQPNYNPVQNKLLNTRPSQRWFDQMNKCVHSDTYIFQKMYGERQGQEAMVEGRLLRIFSSYDYLGLIGHPEIDHAAIEAIKQFGTGTGGVRLLTGTNQLHDQLEHVLRTFIGTESALAFTSGYLANVTAITGLFDGRDVIIADEYTHRSLVDAIHLANVPLKTFKHNDVNALRSVLQNNARNARRALIVVEGIYSMDGDICPLPAIIELKKEFNAVLLVDEAHSLGVLGKSGRGVAEHFNIHPNAIDIFTGSLSKAIPSNGGYIAAREEVIHFLKHGGAPFMFSAALSPPNAAAAQQALLVIQYESWRIEKLWANALQLLNGLKKIQADTGTSESPIMPILCGSNERAFSLSKYLFDAGFLATSVIYPAVPPEMARIRLCAMASMKESVINEFLSEVKYFLER